MLNTAANITIVKIVFIYHVSHGSLLVPCHRVVNKGCCLSPSASLRFLCLRINCTMFFGIHRTLCLRLCCAVRLAFVPPVFAHPSTTSKNYGRFVGAKVVK